MEMTGRDTLSDLSAAYGKVRATTERLASVLSAEDQTVQTMPDVSPTKWHRAHVTWFFETFILGEYAAGYRSFDDAYAYIFNSYYEAVGRPTSPDRARLSVASGHRRDRAVPPLCGRGDGRLAAPPTRSARARRVDHAGAAPRAAAPGAALDGHQARALPQPAAPRLPGRGTGTDQRSRHRRPAGSSTAAARSRSATTATPSLSTTSIPSTRCTSRPSGWPIGP